MRNRSNLEVTYNKLRTYVNWWSYFDVCLKDQSAVTTMKNYCGVLSKTIPFQTSPIKFQGTFATRNLYCRYEAFNPDPAISASFNFTKNYPDINDNYALEVKFFDGRTYIEVLNYQNFTYNSIGITSMVVHYFTVNSKPKIPFDLDFSNVEASYYSYLSLFIALGVVVVVCIICSGIFYKCSKVMMQNNRRNAAAQLRPNEQNQPESEPARRSVLTETERLNRQKKKNYEALKRLFETELAPRKYKEEYNEFQSNCTICQEDFKANHIVVELICRHVFHYKCIKDWFVKQLLEPKCPNCKDKIIPADFLDVEEEKLEEETLRVNTNQQIPQREQMNNNFIAQEDNNNNFVVRNRHGQNRNNENPRENSNLPIINVNNIPNSSNRPLNRRTMQEASLNHVESENHSLNQSNRMTNNLQVLSRPGLSNDRNRVRLDSIGEEYRRQNTAVNPNNVVVHSINNVRATANNPGT